MSNLRVTQEKIESKIVSEFYFTGSQAAGIGGTEPHPLDLLTFCVLVLENGFTVTGESACANPIIFNEEKGREIAREKAIEKIWPLLGYELKQRLHDQKVLLETIADNT